MNERATPTLGLGPQPANLMWPLLAGLAGTLLLLMLMPAPAGQEKLWPMVEMVALPGAALLLAVLAHGLVRRTAQAEALARRVAELEAQLAHATRQRADMLEKISHDLRTPLASMQGYLELLLLREKQLDPTEAQNYLQTAARHSQRLAQRVTDLLELVRLESEAVVLQREPFALAELAHDVVQRFAAAAARAGVRLQLEGVDAERARTTFVLAEVRLVERVLANLVDNALRHTPAGGEVCMRVELQAGTGAVRMSVRDSGAGIASADLEQLFNRHETDARVGDTGRSTPGLGLAIARRIAALHGSALALESQPGAGTCVSFTLPLAPRAPSGHETRSPKP